MDTSISFMGFWKALNEAMKDRNQSEIRFKDARLLWEVATDQDRLDREKSIRRRMNNLAA